MIHWRGTQTHKQRGTVRLRLGAALAESLVVTHVADYKAPSQIWSRSTFRRNLWKGQDC